MGTRVRQLTGPPVEVVLVGKGPPGRRRGTEVRWEPGRPDVSFPARQAVQVPQYRKRGGLLAREMALQMGDPVLRLVEPVNTAAPDVLAATVEALVPGELRACGGGAGGLDAFFAAWRLGQADSVWVNRDRLEAEPLPIVLMESVFMLPTPHVRAVARAAALGSKDRERTGTSL